MKKTFGTGLIIQLRHTDALTVDDDATNLTYTGSWSEVAHASAYGGAYQRSGLTAGDFVTYTFTGDHFNLIYTDASGFGVMDVYIDNVKIASVDQSSATTTYQNVWSSPTLTNAPHTLKLVQASSAKITLDAVQTFDFYEVRAGAANDTGAWTDTAWYGVKDAWNAVEIDQRAFANIGSLTLWLGGVQKEALTFIDNDTRTVTGVRLGAQGIESGTRGTLYFDDFESRRFSYIGLLPDPGTDVTTQPVEEGWNAVSYAYEGTLIDEELYAQPHAVTSLSNGNSYEYDKNGNMTCRVEEDGTYLQTYNAENRIASILKYADGDCESPEDIIAKWDFAYDGDGVRTSQLYTTYDENGEIEDAVVTRYYFGGALETSGSSVKKYYSFAGQTVAMKDDGVFKYFLSDHLGSVSLVLDAEGEILEQQRYLPFGEPRTMAPYADITTTDFTYTGQRDLTGTGLMDYRARFYSPALKRFIQPDTLIPGASNPQNWNRYSYVRNNPINLNDPTGHKPCDEEASTSGHKRVFSGIAKAT